MNNKNLAAMQRAIIMMETAKKMYEKALENMKSELVAVSVDVVRTPKDSVVLNVEVKAEPLPEPPAVVYLPEDVDIEVYGIDFDKEYQVDVVDEEIAIANKLCLLAGLGHIKGEYITVGLKKFYNKDNSMPYVSRYHVNIAIYNEKDHRVAERYIRVESLGECDMFLRKKGALTFNKDYTKIKDVLMLLK